MAIGAWWVVRTTWGWVSLAGETDGLSYVGFPEDSEETAIQSLHRSVATIGVFDAEPFHGHVPLVQAYFSGEPVDLAQLPATVTGSTLQLRIWETTRLVRRGQTITYGELALEAGYPRAARAAGAAMATNPAGLLVPCHRVVAANGIGGYGRHPERKRALLQLEGVERFGPNVTRSTGVPHRRHESGSDGLSHVRMGWNRYVDDARPGLRRRDFSSGGDGGELVG